MVHVGIPVSASIEASTCQVNKTMISYSKKHKAQSMGAKETNQRVYVVTQIKNALG
jgi:hypothetical protein